MRSKQPHIPAICGQRSSSITSLASGERTWSGGSRAIVDSGGDMGFPGPMSREWTASAVRAIDRDFARSADTHLVPLDLPGVPAVKVYIKDESTHLTGS